MKYNRIDLKINLQSFPDVVAETSLENPDSKIPRLLNHRIKIFQNNFKRRGSMVWIFFFPTSLFQEKDFMQLDFFLLNISPSKNFSKDKLSDFSQILEILQNYDSCNLFQPLSQPHLHLFNYYKSRNYKLLFFHNFFKSSFLPKRPQISLFS